MRLDLVVTFGDGSSWVYEVKTLAFCTSNYGAKWKRRAKAWGAGASPADAKAATTAAERIEKADAIDERLGFRGKDGVAHALRGIGKVVGLTVGGCAELSSTVHRLVHHLATQAGVNEARDTGEDVEDCIAAQKQRVGRRIARQVWRDIHQHSTARRQYAAPPPEPTYQAASRESLVRGMDADEVRRVEREQDEAMRVRRDNERTLYAQDGLSSGKGYGRQGRGARAGGRSTSSHL